MYVCVYVCVFVCVCLCVCACLHVWERLCLLPCKQLSSALLSSQQPLSLINWHLHPKYLLTSSCLILNYHTPPHSTLSLLWVQGPIPIIFIFKLYCRTHCTFDCLTGARRSLRDPHNGFPWLPPGERWRRRCARRRVHSLGGFTYSYTAALDVELYRTVLFCTVLYCTVLYCTVLYCTVMWCTVMY